MTELTELEKTVLAAGIQVSLHNLEQNRAEYSNNVHVLSNEYLFRTTWTLLEGALPHLSNRVEFPRTRSTSIAGDIGEYHIDYHLRREGCITDGESFDVFEREGARIVGLMKNRLLREGRGAVFDSDLPGLYVRGIDIGLW